MLSQKNENFQAEARPAIQPQSAFNCEKQDIACGERVLVSEQDIVNTYCTADQRSCSKYFEFLELKKNDSSIGYKKAAKILGISQGSTRWWNTKGAKKSVPLPLKAVEKLKSAGLLPFTENHKHAPVVLNILGTLFGDGGIDCRLNTVAFISADKRDVDLWLSDLLEAFPFAKGKTQIVEGGEYGHSFNVRCYDRAVVRFFAAVGAPVGNKVTKVYSLPAWLFDSSEKSRIAFLDGYLASEVSVPRWRPDSFGNYRFTDFSVGISKVLSLEKEHIAFLKSVELLLHSVGIATTGNVSKNLSAGRLRKDGAQTANYRIFIRTTFHRVLFFDEKFNFHYALGKKQRMQETIEKGKKERLEKQVQQAREHKALKPG